MNNKIYKVLFLMCLLFGIILIATGIYFANNIDNKNLSEDIHQKEDIQKPVIIEQGGDEISYKYTCNLLEKINSETIYIKYEASLNKNKNIINLVNITKYEYDNKKDFNDKLNYLLDKNVNYTSDSDKLLITIYNYDNSLFDENGTKIQPNYLEYFDKLIVGYDRNRYQCQLIVINNNN